MKPMVIGCTIAMLAASVAATRPPTAEPELER